MTKKDYKCMGALMLLFALLAFFRLGNTYAPETSYRTTQANRDIILDFGSYIDIGSIDVFLGNLNSRHFSVSVFNEVTGSWEVINGDAKVESVFAWNTIDIGYNTRYLGLVSLDEEGIFNEFVAVGLDGTPILPENAGDYKALFDEQETYPETKTYMASTMFDEVYHGRTAYEFLHGLTTYETTHPHLGKIIIALGVGIFGMNPFGFRIMSALFGILMVGIMYVFARKMFGSTFIATVTASLLAFDCMHYTLSRIATIDIFIATFILMMYYFMYDYFVKDHTARLTYSHINSEADSDAPSVQPGSTRAIPMPISRDLLLPLGLSGISMAFAVATKFTGIYAGAGLGILFIWYTLTHFPKKQVWKLFFFCCGSFIVLPLLIYTLAFIPVVGYTEYNGLIDKTIQGTLSMYDYHANLVAEHYYSSPFYEWPIIWMPLLYANDAVGATDVSAVSCMGNPAIWWPGILCVFFTVYRWLIKKDKKAGFLTIAYLAQYIPWMSVGRITFIYHYFPAILFTILMLGYVADLITNRFKNGKKVVIGYMAVVIIIFVIFFPVISGLPIDRELGMKLRWLKDWILVL